MVNLKIILSIEIIAIITYYIFYVLEYSFKDFIQTLKDKVYGSDKSLDLRPFYHVFNDYFDNSEPFFFLIEVFGFALSAVAILELTCLYELLKKKSTICRNISCIIILIFCLILTIFTFIIAILEEFLVHLESDEIYIFDDEFNRRIRKNIIFMIIRKIFLIICPLVFLAGIILDFKHLIKKEGNVDIDAIGSEQVLSPPENS